MDLGNAAPAAAALFVSIGSAPTPFKGGTLAAFPPLFTLGMGTDDAGSIHLPFLWPGGISSRTQIAMQFGIADAATLVSPEVEGCVQSARTSPANQTDPSLRGRNAGLRQPLGEHLPR